jgi:GT2 family glycosyltransferase
MNNPQTDIIVPVWNRPVETRNCLVNLINHSTDARFIIVDNGSDRETERILEEFAEILDQRAILLRNNVNQGYVRAVNMGMARSDAKYITVISNTSTVTESWLETLTRFAESRRDAGIIVPRLVKGHEFRQVKKNRPAFTHTEADHASLASMIMTRQAYEMIGGIDEGMDSGLWCLMDLSRRAYRAGFLTFRVEESLVFFEDDVPMGSVERRKTALQRSIGLYRERWGDSRSYCIHMPRSADIDMLRQRLDVLLLGARQGHSFSVITHSRLFKELAKTGVDHLHELIRFIKMPLFFESRALDKFLATADPNMSDVQPVAGIDGTAFPAGIRGIPFAELEQMIYKTRKEIYGS